MSSEVNVKRNKNQRITVDVEEKLDDHNDVVQWKNGNRRRETKRMRTKRRQMERQKREMWSRMGGRRTNERMDVS